MRKQDYTWLASILRDELQNANLAHDNIRASVIKRIARQFAARASVDRIVFLTACGLEVL